MMYVERPDVTKGTTTYLDSYDYYLRVSGRNSLEVPGISSVGDGASGRKK